MWSPAQYLQSVEQARRLMAGTLRRTPLEHSEHLSELAGVPVYLKLELLQVTGSFKARGAWCRLQSLTPAEAAAGIVTCSAGNHGWAVAWAASRMGVPATVFLPGAADPAKLAAIRRLGAETVIPGPQGFDEVEPLALEFARTSRRTFLSAFDDDWVMAGNGGTLAAEILEEIPAVTDWLLPVGGGGLAAGAVRYLAAQRHPFRLVGCQLEASPALKLSLEKGRAVTRLPPVDTWAGGLEGGIGARTFAYLKDHVSEVALLGEAELRKAVIWLLDRHHYLAEPSAMAAVAACLQRRTGPLSGPAVAVVTGRNFDLRRLAALVREAETKIQPPLAGGNARE